MGLKLKSDLPKVIITDGWDGYIQAITQVFPEAEHLLCRFHLLRSVFRRLRNARVYASPVWQQVGSLPFYPLWNRPNLLLLRERMGVVWRPAA